MGGGWGWGVTGVAPGLDGASELLYQHSQTLPHMLETERLSPLIKWSFHVIHLVLSHLVVYQTDSLLNDFVTNWRDLQRPWL